MAGTGNYTLNVNYTAERGALTMTYTLTAHPNTIVRDEDGAFIPTDPDNTDYQIYLAWLRRRQRADALQAAVHVQVRAAGEKVTCGGWLALRSSSR